MIAEGPVNLAPDKRAVFREMYRVLKPGGRVAVSDIALKKPLPDDLARSVLAYVGCVAGATSFKNKRRCVGRMARRSRKELHNGQAG